MVRVCPLCVISWVSEMPTVLLLTSVLSLLVFVRPRSARRLMRTHGAAPVRTSARRKRPSSSDSMTALAAFSSEIRVGTSPRAALRLALNTTPGLCPTVLVALADDGDVAAALRHDAQRQQLPEWNALATVWQLSDERGVSIRPAADQLLTYVKQVVATRHLVAAELAEAMSTMRVLALLPVAGIVLGMVLGANPLGWLLTTTLGQVALLLAVGFEVVGWLWVRAIARRVVRRL